VVKLVSDQDHASPDHAYNAPNLSGTEFLRALYQDRTVPLSLRIEAANHLLRLEPPPRPAPVVTVRIEGGVPAEPMDPDLLARYPVLKLVQ
jgi:hypothetical protein